MKIHRNSQKRIYLNEAVYFITTKTYNGYCYFKEKIICDILIDNVTIGKNLKHFELYAFCILYDHLHLLLKPNNKYNISKVIQNIKMNSARNINKILGYDYPAGENTYSRLQVEKYKHVKKNLPKFKWQQSFHDHVIRDKEDFREHYKYTVYNFQKHNLPKNWKYTSLNYKELINDIIL